MSLQVVYFKATSCIDEKLKLYCQKQYTGLLKKDYYRYAIIKISQFRLVDRAAIHIMYYVLCCLQSERS